MQHFNVAIVPLKKERKYYRKRETKMVKKENMGEWPNSVQNVTMSSRQMFLSRLQKLWSLFTLIKSYGPVWLNRSILILRIMMAELWQDSRDVYIYITSMNSYML